MFPRETTDPLPRRSLAELLRDALGTAVEFATLGEATFDQQAAAKVRYLRPEEAASMHDERPSDDRPTGQPTPIGAGAASGLGGEHPHRLALRRPSRPRRPGAVPPRAPVCTMPVGPVAPAPAPRAADGVLPPAAPYAHRHTPRD